MEQLIELLWKQADYMFHTYIWKKASRKHFFFFKSQKAQTLNELNKTGQLFFSFDRQNQKKKKGLF